VLISRDIVVGNATRYGLNNRGVGVRVPVKATLSLCLTNYALQHKGVWGSECINPHFLDIGTG
jgi:hypothetical protein